MCSRAMQFAHVDISKYGYPYMYVYYYSSLGSDNCSARRLDLQVHGDGPFVFTPIHTQQTSTVSLAKSSTTGSTPSSKHLKPSPFTHTFVI